jgi:hypothetical protein
MKTCGSQPDERRWLKSTYSTGDGECVEISTVDRVVLARDSKDPDGPRVRYPTATWRSFLVDAKQGEFDDLR